MADDSAAFPDLVSTRIEGDELVVSLTGQWHITQRRPTWEAVRGERWPAQVRLDCTALESWDTALLLFLIEVRDWCRREGCHFLAETLPAPMRRLLEQLDAVPESAPAEEHAPDFLTAVGLAAFDAQRKGWDLVRFVGDCVIGAVRVGLRPRRFRWRDCLGEMQHCGAMGLPIVGLISFLVGVTLAYTGANVLRQFGADIWVADLVGLSMVREMAAVMTGIALAGRTGAAFAATLGNMKMNEEIDALATLGIPPIDHLVLPRLVALGVMTPLLTIYAAGLGILGGAMISLFVLDIPPASYWVELLTIVDLSDATVGLIKGVTFGLIVGLSGCLRGLQAERSSAGVGRATTSAVVTAIMLIIMADALYAVIFNILDI